MNRISKIISIFNLLLFGLLFFGSISGDNIINIGKDAYMKEDGSNFKLNYNGTDRLTVNKSTGLVTTGDISAGSYTDNSSGISSFNQLAVSATVGVAESFYVEGDSRLAGKLVMNGHMALQEQSTNPTITAGSEAYIYMKGDKLIIGYNHSGTEKFRILDLTSTDASWTYSTSKP